jgi:prepilin-type N-terminal cleavage/methylation domain-containing protein
MRLNSLRNRKGFTLIELAIVLVIIGIIIGAIMKGRDVIRNAQIKEFANAFAGKWITILDGYFDKTGQNVADGANNGGAAGGADGFMDGGGPRWYQNDPKRTTLFPYLRRAGFDPCSVVKSNLLDAVAGTGQCPDGKNVTQTRVDGEYVSKQMVTVALTNLRVQVSGQLQRKNVLVITDVPLDVAIGIDKIYDGVESGSAGSVINLGDGVGGVCRAAPTTGDPTGDFPGANDQFNPPAAWPVPAAGANNLVCTIGIILEH